jgi:hypothetical protein
LVSRAGLAGGGAQNKDSCQPATAHSSWVDAGWHEKASGSFLKKRTKKLLRLCKNNRRDPLGHGGAASNG